ncbi:hypothetical protein [Actinomadura madurae]|uniref:hypothetical protein n=1 Tax=Actinomadura madurae TaxID=1993 RepID=UPI00355612DB
MTEPVVPAARKTYLQGSRPDIRVPMREVPLTNGDAVVLYDTSGPYTDPGQDTDVRRGLPPLREAWITERGDTAAYEGRAARPEDDGRRSAPVREGFLPRRRAARPAAR